MEGLYEIGVSDGKKWRVGGGKAVLITDAAAMEGLLIFVFFNPEFNLIFFLEISRSLRQRKIFRSRIRTTIFTFLDEPFVDVGFGIVNGKFWSGNWLDLKSTMIVIALQNKKMKRRLVIA